MKRYLVPMMLAISVPLAYAQLSLGTAPIEQNGCKANFTGAIFYRGSLGMDGELVVSVQPIKFVCPQLGAGFSQYGAFARPGISFPVPIGPNFEIAPYAYAFWRDSKNVEIAGQVVGLGAGYLWEKHQWIFHVSGCYGERNDKAISYDGPYVVTSTKSFEGFVDISAAKYIPSSKGYFVFGLSPQGLYVAMSSSFWKKAGAGQ